MLRRAFLKLVSSAGLAMVVGTEHFRRLPEQNVDLLVSKEEITEQLSPVLTAIRAWNEERWMNGGTTWDPEPVPLVKSRFSGRAVAGNRWDRG